MDCLFVQRSHVAPEATSAVIREEEDCDAPIKLQEINDGETMTGPPERAANTMEEEEEVMEEEERVREDGLAMTSVVELIRARCDEWEQARRPPLAIFPEGTTTNGSVLRTCCKRISLSILL